MSIVLDGARWHGDEISLSTTNGGIDVGLPHDFSAKLDVATTNGSIQVEHRIKLEHHSGRRLRGTVGDGDATIRAKTVNGGVSFVVADRL